MRDNLKRIVLTAAGVAALTGGTVAVTDTAVAKSKHKHARKHKAAKKRNAPAALTGDTKTQAEAAALNAVPGGTVEKSFAARAGNPDDAAYVVIVEKADDSYVRVLEDSSFNVIKTEDAPARPDHGPGGPHGDDLTGDTKTQAEAAAASAVPGGTVEHSHTARPDNPDNAAYAVDVKKDDGSEVVVLEDSSFNVLNIVARQDGPRGDGPGGDHPCNGHGGPRPDGGDQQPPQQQDQSDNT